MAPARNHRLSMTVPMTPDMADFSGRVQGGAVLELPDPVTHACASRYARRHVVTPSVDQATCRQPINVGDLVTFLAASTRPRSSIEVGIKVGTGNIPAAAASQAHSGFFTMAAVGEDGTARRRGCSR